MFKKISLSFLSFSIGFVVFAQDGALDLTFNPGVGVNTPTGLVLDVPYIADIKIQTDNKVVLVGDFQKYNDVFVYGIARLNFDGSLDNTFQNELNQTNSCLFSKVAIQSDNKILALGYVCTENGFSKIHRFNSNGSIDNSFQVDYTALSFQTIDELILQSDGKILIVGNDNNGGLFLRRLNNDGSIDTGFQNYNFVGSSFFGKNMINVTPEGRILVLDYAGVKLLNADGSQNLNFICDYWINYPNSVIYNESSFIVSSSNTSTIKINADGSQDMSFQFTQPLTYDPFGQYQFDYQKQFDGKIVFISSAVNNYINVPRVQEGKIFRVNADGSYDNTFETNNFIFDIPFESLFHTIEMNDEYIYVAGMFDSIGVHPYNQIARLKNKNNSATISYLKHYEYAVYPNPFSSSTTIKFDKTLQNVNLVLYNIYGQEVKQLLNFSGDKYVLQKDNLPAGTYILDVQGKDLSQKVKLVLRE